MRKARIERRTKETEITISVNLDGEGRGVIHTECKFLDHMITALATHSLIDIEVVAQGDLKHHLIEDVAICLGECLNKALGKREGIIRFGYSLVPMDCSLAIASIDLVRRPYHMLNLKLRTKKIEDMMAEDFQHFLESFTKSFEVNLHLFIEYGSNDHHKAEAAIKALALSLRKAISFDRRRKNIPSSKGIM